MTFVSLGLAATAGMLAAVNPCGFALLPAYMSLLVIGDDEPSRRVAVTRALVSTGSMTLGFVGVFGLFGLVIAPIAGGVQEYLPWFTLVFGVLMAVAGVLLVAGRALPGPRLLKRGPNVSRSAPSMVGFGAAYALVSLGCTIVPFLVTVVASFTAESALVGVGTFIAYAVGMGVIVGTVALAIALANSAMVARLRNAGRVTSRVGGVVLLLSGAYLAYLAVHEIRSLQGEDVSGDPVIEGARVVQQWLAEGLDSIGLPTVAAGFALLLAAGLAVGVARRRTREPVGAVNE
ncbi:MAG TPA: cytochrome c biogenesis CcdA family protein [Actinokineospora sp.]|nr:cytochrome c biogenesis CcdA family protein [Actinokineospora sp.]